jgi:hypothetical protein
LPRPGRDLRLNSIVLRTGLCFPISLKVANFSARWRRKKSDSVSTADGSIQIAPKIFDVNFFTAEKNGGKKHKSHFFAEPFSGPSVAGLPDGFVFKPKIPIWVNFGGPWNILCTTIWNIYGHLV